jgi:hypothetical protein
VSAVVRIVDGIGGATLLDLNTWSSGAGALLSRDTTELARVTLTDVSARPAIWSPLLDRDLPDRRQIDVPVTIIGTSADDLAARIQTLNKLTAQPFWLSIQRHGGTATSYLQCWPAIAQVSYPVTANQPQTIAVGRLTTDTLPYALGDRVDSSGTVNVTQNPTSTTAFTLDINSVTGDTPTPVCLACSDATSWIGQLHSSIIAVRRRGTPANLTTLYVQAEAASSTSVGGGHVPTVATFGSDATFSNSGGMKVTIPSTSTGGFDSYGILTFAPYPTSGVEARGLYKLLVRVRRSGGAAGAEIGLGAHIGALPSQDLTYPAGGNDTRVVDLGYVPIPCGQPGYQANPGGGAASAAAPKIDLYVWKTAAGAGVVDIDWLALIPADDDLGMETISGVVPASGGWWMLDGYDHTPRIFNGDPRNTGSSASGQVPGQTVTYVGGAPRLQPGNNRLYLVGGLAKDAAASWAPSTTVPITWYYWPRFLGLR